MKCFILICLISLFLLFICPQVQSKSRSSRASKRKNASRARTAQHKQSTKQYLSSLVLQPGNDEKDVFTLLPPMMRYSFRGTADRKLSDHRSQLLSLPSLLSLNVKLVGFEKRYSTPSGLDVSIDSLTRHLDALDLNVAAAVLDSGVGGGPTELRSIRPSFAFRVSHSSRDLSDRVHRELARSIEIESHRPGRHEREILQLSYQSIDRLIAEDSDGQDLDQGHTIYLLNPDWNYSKGHPLPLDYLYSYEELGDEKPLLHSSCPGLHYASPTRPYLWIDITAGPTAYGPSSGQGQVLPHTFPHPRFYKAQEVSTAIIPDLAAMIWSAAQHYIWPPLLHVDGIKRARMVTVQIVHMHESLGPPPDHLDEKSIQSILSSSLAGIQEIRVAETWFSFAQCDICVAAYSSARKVRRGHLEGDDTFAPDSTTTLLDGQILHKSLSRHTDTIMGHAGVNYISDDRSHHVIPVFVFDIASQADAGILIDGRWKAKAFRDLAIAVSSKARKTHSPISCRWFKCEPDGANVTREVLAAVVSSGWGVPEDSVHYSKGSGQGGDYRWSLGATPFGPLSHRVALSHALSQVMRRNLALSGLESVSDQAVRIVDAISKISASGRIDGRTIPIHDVQATIMTRLNLCQLKLSEAARFMGTMQYGHALSMVRSSEVDLRELEVAVRKVAVNFKHPVIECEGVRGFSIGAVWAYVWAPLGAISLVPMAVWARRRIPWNSIRKQDKIF